MPVALISTITSPARGPSKVELDDIERAPGSNATAARVFIGLSWRG